MFRKVAFTTFNRVAIRMKMKPLVRTQRYFLMYAEFNGHNGIRGCLLRSSKKKKVKKVEIFVRPNWKY